MGLFYRGGRYSLPFFVLKGHRKRVGFHIKYEYRTTYFPEFIREIKLEKQPVFQKEIRYLTRFFREGRAFHAAFA